MKKLLWVLCISCGLAAAGERNAKIGWVIPTQRTDKTALPVSEIGGYNIVATSSLDTRTQKVTDGAADSSIMALSDLASYSIILQAFDKGGLPSAWTAPLLFNAPPQMPGAVKAVDPEKEALKKKVDDLTKELKGVRKVALENAAKLVACRSELKKKSI